MTPKVLLHLLKMELFELDWEEEEEAVQYSEDPFSTGLVGVGTTDGLRVVNRVSTMV